MTGLAVVTAVRDRPVLLRASLERWAADPAIDEIVVVDWGSERSLALAGVLDVAGVRVVTAGRGEPWARGLALNLGIEAAGTSHVLCLDPGVFATDAAGLMARLGRGFLSDSGLAAGAVLVAREDALAAGGWHEFLLGEGFAGQDFYNRLEDRGVLRRFFHADELGTVGGEVPGENTLRSPDELRIELPGGLDRDPFFRGERNKLLAGMAPWNTALASLRPRRIGWPDPKRATVQLAPRTLLERRLQDVASYLTARFLSRVSEDISVPMFAEMIDDRSGGDAVRANRQFQIEAALAPRRAPPPVQADAPSSRRSPRRGR